MKRQYKLNVVSQKVNVHNWNAKQPPRAERLPGIFINLYRQQMMNMNFLSDLLALFVHCAGEILGPTELSDNGGEKVTS